MRADRLLDLVALLRRHERLTAAELAERLGVSRRTVLRDMDSLSLSGVPVYAEHGRGGGFSILPGYRPETAGLTAAESEALFLPGGQASADAIGRGVEFRSARRKLEAVLSDDAARGVGDVTRWLLVVPEGWSTPAPAPPAVADLATAAARRHVIDLTYQPRGAESGVRRVRPLGLVLAARTWYLLAERDDTGERRTYRADRITDITEVGRDFTPTMPLVEAWEQARESNAARASIAVKLRTTQPHLLTVRYVFSLAGRVVDVQTRGGVVEISGLVRHLKPAIGLFTGLAHLADVVSPPELIEGIVEASRRNIARYTDDPPGS